MPSISVIIPIYNAEKTLKRALDSVAAQTFGDWEALLINDGSTDGSERICREYCDTDPRFKLFSQENQGVSISRNVGIEKAAGDYIAFLDSDDSLSPDYLQIALTDCRQKDLDLWIGTTIALRNGQEVGRNEPWEQFEAFSDEVTEHQLIEVFNALSSIHGKLVKSSVIEHIRFDPDSCWGEDLVFFHDVFAKHLRFYASHAQVYFYHHHEANGLSLSMNQNKCNSLIKTYRYLFAEVKRRGFIHQGEYYNFILDRFRGDLNSTQNAILRKYHSHKDWLSAYQWLTDDSLNKIIASFGLRFRSPVIRLVHNKLQSLRQ